MRINSRTLLGLAIVLAVAFLPVLAQTPLRVGDEYVADFPTPQNYGPSSGAEETAWFYTVTHPDATYIALHFQNFHLGSGDYLVVSDAMGNQAYVLEGRGKMGAGKFWSQHIKGDTVNLELVTTRTGGGPGFHIDKYAAGFVSLGDPPTEAICGVSDLENAACRSGSPEYNAGRAVARLLMQGSTLCTGWLASASNDLITNEHCITSATVALNTDYEFGAEAPNCGSLNCQLCHPGVIYSGASFVQDDPGLDYAWVTLSGNPAATYGFLQIDNRTATVGEQIYLVSHPSGRAKEFAYSSSEDVGGVGRVLSLNEPTCSGATLELGYNNDTEGGSSGSPVIAASNHQVIALHHCRGAALNCGDPNRGVPITEICADAPGLCGPQCTVDADCDDGEPCTGDTCDSGSCTFTPIPNCCGNGSCETGEDCNSCGQDCISGTSSGATCGNGVCEAGNGEDCVSCAADCNGVQNGRPSNRFCCGADVPCSDSRCSTGGWQCTEVPTSGGTYCCGDLICEGDEDVANCLIDCGCSVDGDCDDGLACNGAETCDGGICQPGADFPCPAGQSCNEPGVCVPDTCGVNKDPCTFNSDCCSNNCKNGSCKGN